MTVALVVIGVALGGAVLLVVAETAARAWLARFGRYYIWAPCARMHMELDRDALPMLEPVARIDINRDGERGAEPPHETSGTFRVLVVGGSAAECYYLDQPTSWAEVIRTELSDAPRLERLDAQRVHVGNVSRSLVACEHLCAMLERVLPHYDTLDAIVFMVGASDVVFWLERGAPEVLHDDPLPVERMFGEHPEGPFGWGPRTLALRRIASHWRHRIQRPVQHKTRTGKRLEDHRAMRAAAEIAHAVPDPAPMVDHFERHFRRLLQLARTKARRVVVARQPWCEKEFTPDEARLLWNFGRGRPYEERVTTYYDHSIVWRLMGAIDASAARIAAEEGVEQVDLNAFVPRTFEYYYDELHHTPRGNRLVGETLAAALADGAR